MEIQELRRKTENDLRGEIRGDLLLDEVHCSLYSTDASLFQVTPLGVALPADEADVQKIVGYCRENKLSITGRGAGSGLAGESLNRGLILDFTKSFRQIRSDDPDIAIAGPGVVYRDLQSFLATRGRRFGPDPASGEQCTVGGMLATNASGARSMRFGYTRDHVAGLRVALDNGDVAQVGLENMPGLGGPAGRKEEILTGLRPLLQDNRELINACRPRTHFNRCGYLLHDVLHDGRLDLARFLVGTEGTLGLFTEAKLRTVPLPIERTLVVAGFSSIESAASAVRECLPTGPSACELIDRRLLTLTAEKNPEYEYLAPPGVESLLMIEYESDIEGLARRMSRDTTKRLRDFSGVVIVESVENENQVNDIWRMRELALPALYELQGAARPVPFIEDVAVPLEHFTWYLELVQDVFQKHKVTGSFLTHAAAGQIHARPFLDMQQPGSWAKLLDMTDEIYDAVFSVGGTISTQHGTGLARGPWVARQYGRMYSLFSNVKKLFDPYNLFNPGKIVDGDVTSLAGQLRGTEKRSMSAETPAGQDGYQPQLRWRPVSLLEECQQCNGCGTCRTEDLTKRMCPMYRAAPDEAATPRAKSNLLREILEGGIPGHSLASNEVREVADLCVNCKMCAIECPAHVNIPKLMLEAKAAHFAENRVRRRDWALARAEGFAALGTAFSMIVNPALRNPSVRWILERTLGVSRKRRLPTFSGRSFLSRAARRGLTQKKDGPGQSLRVAYFVDVYANYNDPLIAEATVRLLNHNGIDVLVPPGQAGCGMAPLAYGDIKTARRLAEANLTELADLARQGYTIICSEPTAALMLRQDYADLVDDPDVALVAARTKELSTFLWELNEEGRLKAPMNPLPISVGHHVPCHVRALGTGIAGPELLRLIPQIRVTTIDISCSGMAGTFGLKEENLRRSLAAGRPMLERLRREDLHFGSSECSACRMQMEHGAGKRSLHPVLYLACACGLLPELTPRLSAPIPDLVLE